MGSLFCMQYYHNSENFFNTQVWQQPPSQGLTVVTISKPQS